MPSQDTLSQEIKAAMLAKDADRLSTLRLLKSAVGYAQMERKTETLSDGDFVAVVQKEVKKRRDAIEQYEKGGRLELAEKETRYFADRRPRASLWQHPLTRSIQARQRKSHRGSAVCPLVMKQAGFFRQTRAAGSGAPSMQARVHDQPQPLCDSPKDNGADREGADYQD
jgi:hypothetical protein